MNRALHASNLLLSCANTAGRRTVVRGAPSTSTPLPLIGSPLLGRLAAASRPQTCLNVHRRLSVTASAAVGPLVNPQWVAERLEDPKLRLLDSSWYMPAAKRDPQAEFKASRIPGSRFFDIDLISDKATSLPHMLPSEAEFAAACDALGITEDSTVVVYDRLGIFSAPRAWWTFRAFGHTNVAVLDGGFPKWQAAGLPIDGAALSDSEAFGAVRAALQDRAQAKSAPHRFPAKLQPGLVRDVDWVLRNAAEKDAARRAQVIDARSAGRFQGTEPEPRASLRGGHIPGSLSTPFPVVLTGEGTFKQPGEIKAAFGAAGVDLSRPITASCGSGLTACILALALARAGAGDVSVYDGSWTEWGSLQHTPIENKEGITP